MKTASHNGRDDLAFHVVETAMGHLGLLFRSATVCRLLLPARSRRVLERQVAREHGQKPGPAPAALRPVVQALRRYCAGEPVDPAKIRVSLDTGTTSPFASRVYAALRRVRRGQTVSYGELACLAGSPGAARAVGGAMARNPLPLLIPCHRVLASSGGLGGFSAPGGIPIKARLLEMEGCAAARS